MPHGELFFRKNEDSAWVDVYDTYGISFTDASLSRLMTPAPNKEHIENKSRLQDGKRVVRKSKYTKKDERDVSLEMHMTAPSKAVFWSRYRAFVSTFLDYGFFDIKHADINDGQGNPLVFRLTYKSCEQFSEFMQQLAKFSLTVNEPDPTDRGMEGIATYSLEVSTSIVNASGGTIVPDTFTVKVIQTMNDVRTEMTAMPYDHAIEVYMDGEMQLSFSDTYDRDGWFAKFRSGLPTSDFATVDEMSFVLRGRTNVNVYDTKYVVAAR